MEKSAVSTWGRTTERREAPRVMGVENDKSKIGVVSTITPDNATEASNVPNM
jgi:hypothetical protein